MIPIQQEPDRVPRGLVRVAALVVVVGIVASIGATLLIGRGSLGEVVRVETRAPANIETIPFGLETEAELRIRLARQRLARYGWVDRQRGIVHIPIEHAIDRYLEERAR